MREQIELLCRHQRERTLLDPAFLRHHAQMIVQLAQYMTEFQAL